MVTKAFRASRGGLSHPPETERRGFGIPRGPRGGKRILRAVQSCHPSGRFPPLGKETGRRIRTAAAVAAATASPGPYWSGVFIRLTSLSLAWPWLGGFGRLVGPVARAGGSGSRRTPHATPFSAVGKVDFAGDRSY